MRTLKIKLSDDIDVDHLVENLIALTEYSDNLTDIEKKAIKKACNNESVRFGVRKLRNKLNDWNLYEKEDEVDEVLTELENKIRKL